jgi:hypothetical protein
VTRSDATSSIFSLYARMEIIEEPPSPRVTTQVRPIHLVPEAHLNMGNTQSRSARSSEKVDLSTPEARQAAAEQALTDLRTGAISAAAAASTASLIRAASAAEVLVLKGRVDELSTYAASLEEQLRSLGQRGR